LPRTSRILTGTKFSEVNVDDVLDEVFDTEHEPEVMTLEGTEPEQPRKSAMNKAVSFEEPPAPGPSPSSAGSDGRCDACGLKCSIV
jgi:hypothetical protein